jgi:hypothetical protein
MCGESKSRYSEFYGNYKTKDGRLSWCKPCTSSDTGRASAGGPHEFRAYIQSIKMERGCTDCGYREHPAALDFDHLPGFVKKGTG